MLKRLLTLLKKEPNMSDTSKLHVIWQLNNDGLRPTEAPWGFIARNPLTRAIPPNSKMTIDLYVAANCAMLAFPSRSHQDEVTVPQIIQAGQSVIVVVENRSQHSTLILDDKEPLVNLFPLLLPNGTTSEVG